MGPPAPEGCVGQVWEGTSPRWAGAPPHQGPRRMGEWEGANPRSRCLRAHLVGRLPLSSPWPPPLMGSRAGRLLLGVETLRGAQPPSPLYILEVWAAIHTRESLLLVLPYPSPSSSSPAVLGEALRDCHAPPPPPCRRVAAGWSLPQPLPLSLLDQGMGDVTGLHVC